MAAQGKPTCETEINFLVDLDDLGDVLPETIPQGLRERFPCFIIAYVIEKKLVTIHRIRKENNVDEISRRVHLNNLGKLKAKGYLVFDFAEDAKELHLKPEVDHESVTSFGVILTLLVSSVVTAGSFLHILCFTKSRGCEGGVTWNNYALGHREIFMFFHR